MKRTLSLLTLFALALFVGGSLHAGRTVSSLNGEWMFCVDRQKEGEKDYAKGLLAEAVKVQVPHTWNVQDGLEEYADKAWYARTFSISKEAKGKDVRIRFQAVYRDAVVYVNGRKATVHSSSGYTPFHVDIADLVRYGADNQLVVSVSNAFSTEAIPYGRSFDWANDGGIIRGVELIIADRPSIRYAHVRTANSGEVNVDVRLWKASAVVFDCTITIREHGSGIEVARQTRVVKPSERLFSMAFSIENPKLWHFDHPELYDIEVNTGVKGRIADVYTSRFGFKEVKAEGDKLLLNGEPVRLVGVE